MTNIIKENWGIIEEKVIKPMYEDGSFSLTVADEVAKALEKQIPKKPEWNLQNDAILCPCCGLDLMGGVEIDSEIDPEHCWNCGQAIDWGNEDE